MSRQLRKRACSGLFVLSVLFMGGAARGDIVWKIADEGLSAPDRVEVLGDDSRVLALGFGGPWELDGTVWHPVKLDTSASGANIYPRFSAGGRIVTVTLPWNTLQVFVLQGNVWRLFAEVPASGSTFVYSDERIFVPSQRFNDCESAPACDPPADAGGLRSVSLADGTVREEPPLPGCSGHLFVLSGKLHFIAFTISCAEPSAGERSATATSATSYPFYRLDGDHWTELPPWNFLTWGLKSTPNSFWTFYGIGQGRMVARVLTTAGMSEEVAIPGVLSVTGDYPIPLEWNGRLLLSTGRGNGDLHELKDGRLIPFTPESPVTAKRSSGYPLFIGVAGHRLFTSARGWDVHFREADAWVATSGITSGPGADGFLMGSTKTFATQGTSVLRRDAAGWTRLAPVPGAGRTWGATVLGDRPVLGVGLDDGVRVVAHDPASNTWEDLHLPTGFGGTPSYPSLISGGRLEASASELFAIGPPGKVARYRDGAWNVISLPSLPPVGTPSQGTLRVLNGSAYLLDWYAAPDATAWVLRNDRLEKAFPSLDPRIKVRDVASAGERLILSVHGGFDVYGYEPFLLEPSAGGFRTLLTWNDLEKAPYSLWSNPVPLSVVGERLLFSGLVYTQGRLRAGRGPAWPGAIDGEGRFGIGYDAAARALRLLSATVRVRKNLAASVDTTGKGGVRYRSTLTVANLSLERRAVARVFAGGATSPTREIPLAPGAQVRLDDPVPDFVGPLAVEFEGLSDEAEAWAAIRVWSPSEGGTAGTSLLGTDPGSVPYEAVVLPPVRTAGSRLHLALAAANDGSGSGISVPDLRRPLFGTHPLMEIPSGGFLQLDPHPDRLYHVFVIPSFRPRTNEERAKDDLLGYLVRNDGTTNDGTVVPFEEPDALPGRRTRFLPAVVGASSEHGRYRTELSLGCRKQRDGSIPRLDFSVAYRDDERSETFPISIYAGFFVEVPDAGAWLVANGVPIDPANFAGTLTFTSERPEGAAALLVTAVVQARGRNSAGDYGVSVPVVNEVRWANERAIVPGLREDGSFRSNVALANPEPDGGPDVTLRVTLHQAVDGAVIGTLPAVSLAPGRRLQLDRPLKEIGYGGDAWAEVRRVGGSGRFVAYGVVNDNVTSDGTLLPMVVQR